MRTLMLMRVRLGAPLLAPVLALVLLGPALTPAAADPVAASAAAAAPGSEPVAALPDTGGRALVRLLRSYNAATGRECREVLVGTGVQERTRLVCRNENGGWVPARPLLSGGARS